MPKKIAFITFQDNANLLTHVADALNRESDAYEVRVFSYMEHPFAYDVSHDMDFITASAQEKLEHQAWMKEVSAFIWAEESFPGNCQSYLARDPTLFNQMTCTTPQMRSVPRAIFHGGTWVKGVYIYTKVVPATPQIIRPNNYLDYNKHSSPFSLNL